MPELIWDGKYKDGKKVAPTKIALPFQSVETVNESAADRARTRSLFAESGKTEWRNRLIWGDKKYVLPSLLPEFAGQVNLIYIDPPFDTGANFSFTAQIPDDPDTPGDGSTSFVKEPSILELKAYRDIWGGAGNHLDSYLKWFYETAVLLYELLASNGSLYVHLDWRLASYARIVLDEIFGVESFRNEIYWYYYNKMHDSRKGIFPRATDTILFYSKDHDNTHTFNLQHEKRDKPVKQLVRKKVGGKMINARDEEGNVLYIEATHRTIDNVWRIPMLQPADQIQNLRYPTQKPEALLERIIKASSNEDDLVLDCFCGSGTTAAVAEKLSRRWITCDLGRFAIHTARKRLLGIENVRPFVVQNLGKYERQHWQRGEFGQSEDASTQAALAQRAYTEFILQLYRATPISGCLWLHGVKAGRHVHVGSVDAPVTDGDLKQIAAEFRRAVGTGDDAPETNGLDILGWDFAFEVNEAAKQQMAASNLDVRFKIIPREVMERKAVEQGDIQFFELAALQVETRVLGRRVEVELKNFTVSPDYVPADVQRAVTHWEQYLDYWAIDWNSSGALTDTFHNQWQSYRTRNQKTLERKTSHVYDETGTYRIVVKAIDLLGNDTTKVLKVEVK